MSIVNNTQQYVTVSAGEKLSFESDGQTYLHAKLLDIQKDSVLIETAMGGQEAIAIDSMKLIISLSPSSSKSISNIAPSRSETSKKIAIGFPLDQTGIKVYNKQGTLYADTLYQGVVPVSQNPAYSGTGSPVSSVTVVTINVPVYVEIITLADGSQNVNIYDQANYPSVGTPSYYPNGIHPALLAEEQRVEKERLDYLMNYS